ncbi:MAG: tyrosine-type recombinase/integrase [Ruminococcus sp.]|nr:tyrosine-type recombinase/integrase [Ruminococcus sp.]
MYMGLRIGEVCALQWRDIDLEKRTLTVSKTILRVQCMTGAKHTKLIITEPKSESSKRTIPILDCLLPLLRQFKDNGEVYVVSGMKKPIEPRTMQYRFAKILHNAEYAISEPKIVMTRTGFKISTCLKPFSAICQ